jgi:hypothetical protein
VAPSRVQVDFARSGGLAGMSVRTSVDTAELPPGPAAEVERLVAAVEASGLPKGSRPGADRFQYDLTISRGGRSQSVSVGEKDLSPELEALCGWLLRHARSGG